MPKLKVIRRLSETDSVAYSVLRKEANADDNYRGNRDAETDLSENEAKRLITNVNTIVIGAFSDDELVGMVSLGWMAENFTLFGLFVLEKYRREGMGGTLTSSIIKECKKLRAKTIRLEVARSNKEAISLYEKMGFTFLRRNSKTLKLVLIIEPPSGVI